MGWIHRGDGLVPHEDAEAHSSADLVVAVDHLARSRHDESLGVDVCLEQSSSNGGRPAQGELVVVAAGVGLEEWSRVEDHLAVAEADYDEGGLDSNLIRVCRDAGDQAAAARQGGLAQRLRALASRSQEHGGAS